jgi:hypothetical protein
MWENRWPWPRFDGIKWPFIPELSNLTLQLWSISRAFATKSLYICGNCHITIKLSNRSGYVVLQKDSCFLRSVANCHPTSLKHNISFQKQLNRECYQQIKPSLVDKKIFISQKESACSVQRINVIFKSIKSLYILWVEDYSIHSMRKAFGWEVFPRSGTHAELSLMKLSQLFNHSSVLVTRRYLGITRDELLQTYDVLSF